MYPIDSLIVSPRRQTLQRFLISSRVGASHSISASPELTEPQPITQPYSLHQDKTPGLKQAQPPAEASHQRIYLQ
jgi:hypothetical protein